MAKEDEVFADAFGEAKSAPKEPEIKTVEAPAPEPPKEPEPTAQKEAAEATPPTPVEAQQPPQDQLSPEEYRALKRVREEAKEAKMALEIERLKAANYERELAQFKQQQTKEPTPDIYENPEGYRQHLEAQYDKRLTQMKLEQSEFLASRDYGADLVGEVKQWAMQLDNARAEQLLSKPSPFHAAVEMFKQEKATAALKEHDYDLEKMKAKWLAEYQAQPPAAPLASPPPANLPPKIAGVGGSLGKAPTPSEDTIFKSVFSR